MKIATLCESPADSAGLWVLIEAITGRKHHPHPLLWLRSSGSGAVLGALRVALLDLYYQTDVDGLAVLIDSDDSIVHRQEHEEPEQANAACRLCQMRQIIASTERQLRPLAGRAPVKVALGLAVPAIEAWWLCGRSVHYTEAAWVRGRQSAALPYTRRDLKRDLYGAVRVSLPTETSRMVEAAQRVCGDLDALERAFPGFGFLRRDPRLW